MKNKVNMGSKALGLGTVSVLALEVAIVTAVSKRHVESNLDSGFLHRWSAVFRGYGTSMHVDMTYEPCNLADKQGVERVVFYDELSSA